jgi:hypothetical protein
MQFGLAFQYFLNRTGSGMNLLLVTVCNLIPFVGPIVSLGYRAEVAQSLIHDEELERPPLFTFDRFVEYLTRGLWPFITSLVVTLCVLPLIGVVVITSMMIAAAGGMPELGLIVGLIGYFGSFILLMALVTPMAFYAELSGKLDLPGSFGFAREFWTLVPGPAIITILVFIPLSIVVTIIGLILCFVGVYPAQTVIQMAGLHLVVQLYLLFLERGGTPIPEFVEEVKPRRRRRRRDKDDDDDWDDDEDR